MFILIRKEANEMAFTEDQLEFMAKMLQLYTH